MVRLTVSALTCCTDLAPIVLVKIHPYRKESSFDRAGLL